MKIVFFTTDITLVAQVAERMDTFRRLNERGGKDQIHPVWLWLEREMTNMDGHEVDRIARKMTRLAPTGDLALTDAAIRANEWIRIRFYVDTINAAIDIFYSVKEEEFGAVVDVFSYEDDQSTTAMEILQQIVVDFNMTERVVGRIQVDGISNFPADHLIAEVSSMRAAQLAGLRRRRGEMSDTNNWLDQVLTGLATE